MEHIIENIDWNHIKTKETHTKTNEWHYDKARMNLAYRVLFGIIIIFFASIICDYLAHIGYLDNNFSTALFDLCKTGLLPIVTLILGYYFSKDNLGSPQ